MNYLYQITNLINNKIYVGVHKNKLDTTDDGYMGSGKHLKYAQRKYGIENFKKEVLEIFETFDHALKKERTIVNEDFIARKDTYNIRIGGRGGNFTKEDSIRGAKKGGQAYKMKVKSLDGTELEKYKNRMKQQSKLGSEEFDRLYKEHSGIWWTPSNKSHTEEILKKMRGPRLQSSGNKNSQFGTCWITKDKINKKVKRNETTAFIDSGWQLGRYMPRKF